MELACRRNQSLKIEVMICHEGILYSGVNVTSPTKIWDYARKKWVQYNGGQKPDGWGREISAADADKLKTNNPDAEHYLYFDTPPWSSRSAS